MDRRKMARERRKQRTFERIGTDRPVCVGCGETHFACFEDHHLAGRKHDDTTWPICANCHRKVTDEQKDHPAASSSNISQLELIGRFLLGLADLFRLVVEKMTVFGLALIEHAIGAQVREVRS